VRHNDPKAEEDPAMDAALEEAYQALSDELKRWQSLAGLNSETISNIDSQTFRNFFRSSERWRSLFSELKTTLRLLSNQYTWLEDAVQREIDPKKGNNNEASPG